jgi:hypothetical protein
MRQVTEVSQYRHLRTTFVVDAGAKLPAPATLHLAKYSTNYNHRELNGHRFSRHAYRPRERNSGILRACSYCQTPIMRILRWFRHRLRLGSLKSFDRDIRRDTAVRNSLATEE